MLMLMAAETQVLFKDPTYLTAVLVQVINNSNINLFCKIVKLFDYL